MLAIGTSTVVREEEDEEPPPPPERDDLLVETVLGGGEVLSLKTGCPVRESVKFGAFGLNGLAGAFGLGVKFGFDVDFSGSLGLFRSVSGFELNGSAICFFYIP